MVAAEGPGLCAAEDGIAWDSAGGRGPVFPARAEAACNRSGGLVLAVKVAAVSVGLQSQFWDKTVSHQGQPDPEHT